MSLKKSVESSTIFNSQEKKAVKEIEEDDVHRGTYSSEVFQPLSYLPLHKFHRQGSPYHRESRPSSDSFLDKIKKLTEGIQNEDEYSDQSDDLHYVDVTTQLSEMETVSIICVLESIGDMLNILSHTNEKAPALPHVAYHTLKERFGEHFREHPLIDLELCLPVDLDSEQAKFRKIQRERGAFEVTLINIIQDLIRRGNYNSLENFVKQNNLTRIEEEKLLQQKKKIDNSIANLKLKIQNQRIIIDEKRHELEVELATTRDDMVSVVMTNSTEACYINKWETARGTQHSYALQNKEELMKTNITESKVDMDKEMLINNHILDFFNIETERLRSDINEWSDKSFVDLERIDLDTKIAKTSLDEVKSDTEDLRAKYQKRSRQIFTYYFKHKLEHLYITSAEQREKAALSIQKWWRAMMKLHKLGPYKKKKKKGKGKKGKGKKGKGKKGKGESK